MAELLEDCPRPMVIDADGLNHLAKLRGGLPALPEGTVLTPHPGEMRRLWPAFRRTALPDARTEQAAELARASGAVVVLKGAGTVVSDGARVYVNDTGNPGMATGGSGDVLTGVIAALIGQGLAGFDAAALGVWAHGWAGDLAAARSETALIASDLLESLSAAWAAHRAEAPR